MYLFLQKSSYDYEQSELLLYMHQVMFEGGLYQRSLSHLQSFEDQICDKLSLMEARGHLFLFHFFLCKNKFN